MELSEVRYIYHISDIRINPYKRFQEYTELFDRLLKILVTDNSVLIITGNILDNDLMISPQSLCLIHKLFSVSKIMPIIIILSDEESYCNIDPYTFCDACIIAKGFTCSDI